jgi:hypothetical protein
MPQRLKECIKKSIEMPINQVLNMSKSNWYFSGLNPIVQFITLSTTIFIWLQTTVTVGKIRQEYHSNRIAFLKKRLHFSVFSARVKKMTHEFSEDEKN